MPSARSSSWKRASYVAAISIGVLTSASAAAMTLSSLRAKAALDVGDAELASLREEPAALRRHVDADDARVLRVTGTAHEPAALHLGHERAYRRRAHLLRRGEVPEGLRSAHEHRKRG